MATTERRWRRGWRQAGRLTVAALALGACGGDGEGRSEGAATEAGRAGSPGASVGGAGTGAGTGGGAARGDERWRQAFAEAGFALKKTGEHECEASAEGLEASGLARASAGGATIYVGYHQVTADNQDPFAARVEGGRVAWCKYHENDGPDGRAVGITWDGGPYAYVVYTIVGGGTDLELPGWFRSYGGHAGITGGNKKVGVIGRLDAAAGGLVAATHVPAVLGDRKVNSHAPAGPVTVLADGTVEYRGSSAHKPLGADGKNAMQCTDYPFDTTYRFGADLATVVCATSTNCTGNLMPCE